MTVGVLRRQRGDLRDSAGADSGLTDGAAVEMLFAIGEGDRIVGTHSYVTYPPETESITKVGDAFNMDIEAIAALEPDLVYVVLRPLQRRPGKGRAEGAVYQEPVARLHGRWPTRYGCGAPLPARRRRRSTLRGEFDERVHDIEHKMEEVEPTWTVYSHGFDWWTPGRNTLVNDVFELLKLENVADFEGYQQINPEIIVANEPDIIMADSVESVTENPVLSHAAHGGRPNPYPAPHIRDEQGQLLQRRRAALH